MPDRYTYEDFGREPPKPKPKRPVRIKPKPKPRVVTDSHDRAETPRRQPSRTPQRPTFFKPLPKRVPSKRGALPFDLRKTLSRATLSPEEVTSILFGGDPKTTRRTVNKLSDFYVGKSLTNVASGDESPGWEAILQAAMLPVPGKGLPSLGTKAGRILFGAKDAAQAVRAGEGAKGAFQALDKPLRVKTKTASSRPADLLAKAARKARVPEPIVKYIANDPREQRIFSHEGDEIAAIRGYASSRTGKALEKAADKARPVTSKVPGIKSEQEMYSREFGKRLKALEREGLAPLVLLERSIPKGLIRRMHVPDYYALRMIGKGITPERAVSQHLQWAAEAEAAGDALGARLHSEHATLFQQAARYVEVDPATETLVLTDEAPQHLHKVLMRLENAAQSREEILGTLDLLGDDVAKLRIENEELLYHGGRLQDTELYIQKELEAAPNRQKLLAILEGLGKPEFMETIDALARSHLRRTVEARRQMITKADEILASSEDESLLASAQAMRDAAQRNLTQGADSAAFYKAWEETLQGFSPEQQRELLEKWGPNTRFETGTGREYISSLASDEAKLARAHEKARAGNKNYLPAGAQSGKGLQKLINELHDRAAEGLQYGRDWYSESGQTILRYAGGDIDRADNLAALTAIYSPQQPVVPNIGLALRAVSEYVTKGTVTVGQDWQRSRALDVLEGRDWRAAMKPDDGLKIRAFYGNLLKHIDPQRAAERGYDGREVTADGWMGAAFGYGANTKQVKIDKNQYRFIERVTQGIADALGIEPEQAQAAIWTSIKAQNDRWLAGLPKDESLPRAGVNFLAGLERPTHTARFAFEGASQHVPEYSSWPVHVQEAFLQANADAVLATMLQHGFYGRLTDYGIGVWRASEDVVETNPAAALEIAVGNLPKGDFTLDEASARLYDGIAAVIGKNLMQDAGGWVRPMVPVSDVDHTFARVTAQATPEQLAAISDELEDIGYITQTSDGFMVVRYDPETVLDEADRKARAVAARSFGSRVNETIGKVLGPEAVDTIRGGSHRGGYVERAGYGLAVDSSGRPDLLGGVDRDLAAAAEAIRAAFRTDPERAARELGGARGVDDGLRPAAERDDRLRGELEASGGDEALEGVVPGRRAEELARTLPGYDEAAEQLAAGALPTRFLNDLIANENLSRYQKIRVANHLDALSGGALAEHAGTYTSVPGLKDLLGKQTIKGAYNPPRKELVVGKHGDVGTVWHELTHMMQIEQVFPADFMEQMAKFLGVPEGNANKPWEWTEDQLESLAHVFEGFVLGFDPTHSKLPGDVRLALQGMRDHLWDIDALDDQNAIYMALPDEIKDAIENLLFYQRETGAKFHGAKGYRGRGQQYMPEVPGMPVAILRPWSSAKTYATQFGAALRRGQASHLKVRDPHLEKQFTGSLIRSGRFHQDIFRGTREVQMKAARINAMAEVRERGLKIGKPVPGRYDDIAVPVDLAAWRKDPQAKRVRSVNDLLSSLDRSGKIGAGDVRKLDQEAVEEGWDTAFFGLSRRSEEEAQQIAQEIIDGARAPIDNVVWVDRKTLMNTGMFDPPRALAARTDAISRGAEWGINAVNDYMKASILLLNPAYYPMNVVGNGVMLLMQQGALAPLNIMRAAKAHWDLGDDAFLIDHHVGGGLTTPASLSSAVVSGKVSHLLQDTANLIVDRYPRRAAFIYEARKLGYESTEEIRALLTNAEHADDLRLVSQRTKDKMVDFDNLSQWEKDVMTKWIFVYPWIKGASVWALRFPKDHPAQAMAYALLYAYQQDMLSEEFPGGHPYYLDNFLPIGERDGMPWGLNTRQAFTYTTPLDVGASVGRAALNLEGEQLAEMLNPIFGEGVRQITGYDTFEHKEVDRGILPGLNRIFNPREAMPVAKSLEKALRSDEEREQDNRSRLYASTKTEDWLAVFGGSLAPRAVNPEVAQKVAHRGEVSAEDRVDDWAQEIEKVTGSPVPEPIRQARLSKSRYEKHKAAVKKELGKDELAQNELLMARIDTFAEMFPDEAENAAKWREQAKTMPPAQAKAFLEVFAERMGWPQLNQYERLVKEMKGG